MTDMQRMGDMIARKLRLIDARLSACEADAVVISPLTATWMGFINKEDASIRGTWIGMTANQDASVRATWSGMTTNQDSSTRITWIGFVTKV